MAVEGLPGTVERTLRTCVGHRRLRAVGRPLYDRCLVAAAVQSTRLSSRSASPVDFVLARGLIIAGKNARWK